MLCVLILNALLGGVSPQGPTWETKELGTGGQPMLAANDKGAVYLAHHQPGALLISRDWGATFAERYAFKNALSDVRVSAWADRVQVTYLTAGGGGIENHYSFDAGKSLRVGGRVVGDYDRGPIVYNAKSAELTLVTSHGYPAGPLSQGIFAYRSTDFGRTFSRAGRVDVLDELVQAVDPNLAVSTDGTLYASWSVTKDNNNIASIEFATSTNGGKNWKDRTQIAKLSTAGDTQERWMLGGLIAMGESTVVAYYPDYVERKIGDEKKQILLTHFRISEDSGRNFGPARICLTDTELETVLKAQPNYRQTMPAMALDASGNLHLAFIDNREGGSAEDSRFTKWSARYMALPKGAKDFGPSEAISKPFASIRAPLELIGCAVDSKYVYVAWSENPGSTESLDYRGTLYFGRKAVGQ